MVGFTIPLLYFGTVAAKTFMQLEEQAIKFKRVYGDMFTTTADATKALKDVQLLANEFTKYGVAVADTMKMAADVAATGKVGADLMAQVTQASKLAILGNIDQAKSLDTLISLTSTFGIASQDLAKNIDFLNAVENQTILNIDDLTTAIPKAAPVIKQLGGDVQDLAFFMTAMREGGIQAGEGANALKSGLASLINPSKKASEFLGGMGINLKGIVEANKGDVKNLVIDFGLALDKLEPLKRAQAIEQLFGKFQFARMSTLFQNVIKEGTQAQTVAQLTSATVEELAILSEREMKKIEDSPMYKFKKQIEDLKVTLVPIGAEFLKALTPVVEFFSKILGKFDNFSDGTKQFITYFTAILAGIGPIVLMSFGLLANGLANIIKGFTAIKGVFNRAGQSSTVLGMQTDYLTQQQLEAAAVAASLDQTHMKLTQSFNSEAEAIRRLAASYNQAVAAQRAFGMGGMPGKGPRPQPKGYAKGVVSVPGSGTGDKVPAMLSPKEAIIPAPMAKKYAPLISGMIADNIPGFAKGYQNAHATLPFETGSPQYVQALKTTSAAFREFAIKFPQMISVVSNLVAKLPGVLNQQMKSPSGATVADFKQGYAANSGKFNLSAKLGGLDMADKNATAALQRLEYEIGKRIA
jgi:TP901 family phage tail tape measure protein